jgi:hypothetical protein
MLELMAALVAVLALLAGLVQMVSLARARHDTRYEARSAAGEAALDASGSGMGQLSDAEYILDWDRGPDGLRHTRDDRSRPADAYRFSDAIVRRSSPDPEGWAIVRRLQSDPLSMLVDQPNPAALYGLIESDAREEVPLLPAVRRLLYDAESIEVESRVWMTWTKGIY